MRNETRYVILASMFTGMGVLILVKSLMSFDHTALILSVASLFVGVYYFYAFDK